MRSLVVPERADIIVSELLGSFGDNELCPECLDGAMRFLKRKSLIFLSFPLPSFMAYLQQMAFQSLRHTRHILRPYPLRNSITRSTQERIVRP